MIRTVYLDNAATSQLDPEALAEMQPYFLECYGNPSSLHRMGVVSGQAIALARERIARTLRVKPENVIFTSGGTEADNLAILGVAKARAKKGRHLVTTAIEHPAVLNACRALSEEGFEVTIVPCNRAGIVESGAILERVRPDTILVACMHVSNEIGTIQPVAEIGRELKRLWPDCLFHVDAVQSYGKIPLYPEEALIDFCAISAHKIHGPKGIGALVIRSGQKVGSIMYGGPQERRLRPGTENVLAIVGFGKAAELANQRLETDAAEIRRLRDLLIDELEKTLPMARLNGDRVQRLPHNANLSFGHIQGEVLLHLLEEQGIFVSAGAACSSRSAKGSHVLAALQLSVAEINSALRFSLSRYTSAEDIRYVIEQIGAAVMRLNQLRPVSRPNYRTGKRDV
jgi:cysteine desulfurase